jgi:hypothetical protein
VTPEWSKERNLARPVQEKASSSQSVNICFTEKSKPPGQARSERASIKLDLNANNFLIIVHAS